MKKFLVSAAAMLAFGSVAGAADLPVKGPAPVVARPACAQFGGFYVGANAGFASYTNHWSDQDGWAQAAAVELPSNVRTTDSGFIGGVGAGYNWQRNCTVFGVEGDYSWADVKNEVLNSDGQVGAALDRLSVSSRIRGFGTLRTRTGVIVDDILIYVTGGLAFAQFDRSATLTDNIGGVFVSETFSSNNWRYGWTVGVGTEWAINNNWSLKGETLYAQFKSDNQTFNAVLESTPTVLSKRFQNQDEVWIGRIGVNYRWGGR